MKKYSSILILLMSFGCSESFLDVPLTDTLNQDVIWSEEETAQAAVNGIYNQLTSQFLYRHPTLLDAARVWLSPDIKKGIYCVNYRINGVSDQVLFCYEAGERFS